MDNAGSGQSGEVTLRDRAASLGVGSKRAGELVQQYNIHCTRPEVVSCFHAPSLEKQVPLMPAMLKRAHCPLKPRVLPCLVASNYTGMKSCVFPL